MSLVRYGAGIGEINGQVGGDVFRRDQCGNHVQAPPRNVYSSQRHEGRQQKAFRKAKNAWLRHDWTKAELDAWWSYCSRHPITNKKGEVRYMHPFLAFLSVNIRRFMNGLEPRFLPPD